MEILTSFQKYGNKRRYIRAVIMSEKTDRKSLSEIQFYSLTYPCRDNLNFVWWHFCSHLQKFIRMNDDERISENGMICWEIQMHRRIVDTW